MQDSVVVPKEKKLLVLYRVEPGCLGPDGANYVKDFCQYAQNKFINHHNTYVCYQFTPRFDKSLAETEYSINHKRLSYDKAGQYMALFEQTLANFEEDLEEQITNLIDTFFKR